MCSITFFNKYPATKTCSKECRDLRLAKITGRYADRSISACTSGAMSEYAVALDLMGKGYSVFRAMSPACFCDLLISKVNSAILRVEVKTGYISERGSLCHPPIVSKYKNSVDILGIYSRNEKRCIYKDAKGNIIDL